MGAPMDSGTVTLTGAVNLTSDFILNSSVHNVNITGQYTTNGHTFSVQSGSTGTLTTPEGTIGVPVETITASDNQPTRDEHAGNNQTLILTGARGIVSISSGGLLKGTGIANSLLIDVGGTVAPGDSPGTLTVLDSFVLWGTYQAELLNKDSYDKIKAGTVQLSGVLDTVLYSGYAINQGDQFMIIENTGADPVNGIFTGLPEGTQFTVGNVTFSITYVGGNGNDVVLTALNTGSDPNAPDTAVAHLVTANPITVMVLGIVTAGFFVGLMVRRSSNR
jgi:hypothetical protein